MSNSETFELITPEQQLSTYNKNLDNLIANLNIQSLTSSIVQIPSSDNEYHGVATAKLTTSNGEEFSGFGEAYADDGIPKNMVLRYADMFAKTDACTTASISLVKRKSDTAKTNYQQSYFKKKYGNKSSYSNNYNSNPITANQINYINGLAKNIGKSGNDIAQERFNASIDNLNYTQASELIKDLTNK